MTLYEKADQLIAFAKPIIERHHNELAENGVRIDFLWARAEVDEKTGQPKGPALQDKGHRVYGKAKVMSLKDRAAGRGDAEIIIDQDHWNEISVTQQKALLSHELEHLQLSVGRDDLGRPKMKIKPHDIEIGMFIACARRYGEDSIECQSAKIMFDSHRQALWPNLLVEMPEAREAAETADN